MEDVLDVYKLPYDENCPVICLDEKPYQLLDEKRLPIPMKQGKSKCIDNEYVRMGSCSIFVMCEPLKGWIHANARERRTAVDFAHEVRWLLTESKYKDAPKIRFITDNLNTHNTSSFYKAFPPEEARKMAERIEWHYTPKKGSWLNIAEISISILAKQCIDRRIPSLEMLNEEIQAWEAAYNSQGIAVKWQFTTVDARVKLLRLYPVL